MLTSPSEYRAFFTMYKGLTNELTTPVGVSPIYTDDPSLCGVFSKAEALWDTGATASCIKPSLCKHLKLHPLGSSSATELSGIGGKTTAALTLLDIRITPDLEIQFCPMYSTDFPGNADILIGMDIIGMGDFAVCNTDNITSFTFAVPSFPDRLNFADKADMFNSGNKVHCG